LAVAAGASVSTPAFAILVAIAAVAETARLASPPVAAALGRLAGGAFRPAEAHWPSGAGTLALGYALVWWLFAPAVAEAAIVVTALADPAAALVGSRFGRGAAKSVPGSLACACVAAMALAVFGFPPAALVVAAVGAAAAERAPGRGTDNLAVPLVVGALLHWLQ
jgi:dolichol kinase